MISRFSTMEPVAWMVLTHELLARVTNPSCGSFVKGHPGNLGLIERARLMQEIGDRACVIKAEIKSDNCIMEETHARRLYF
jgi:hypothetical protein